MNPQLPVQTEIEKNVFEVAINLSHLNVNHHEVGLTLGYEKNKIPTHFADIINEIISNLPERCDIKAGYRLAEIEKSKDRKDGLVIGNNFFKMDKIVTGQIKNSESAALFICTIGAEMENLSRKFMTEGDPAMGFLVDTVASVTVEYVTDVLHDFIGYKMEERGLKITNRYSPGYCNWSVSEQHLLFSMLPKNFCGITLSESALMHPIKSVSGVIGIGAGVKRKEYICDRCGVRDCTYRSKRSVKNKP